MELLVFILGVLSSIVAYFFLNFFLAPVVRFYELKAKIGHKLHYYSHIITSPSPGSLADEASPIIRDLAIELEEKYLLIPLVNLASKLKFVPKIQDVIDTKGRIIFISNSVHSSDKTDNNLEALEKIYTLLNIRELTKRYNKN